MLRVQGLFMNSGLPSSHLDEVRAGGTLSLSRLAVRREDPSKAVLPAPHTWR